MKKPHLRSMHLLLLLFLLFLAGCTQPPVERRYNLDFEEPVADEALSKGWMRFGPEGYALEVDSTTAHSGIHSLHITQGAGGGPFGAALYLMTGRYRGDSITLSGWVRTQGIDEGMASLLLRIDGPDEALQFGNTFDQAIGSHQEEWIQQRLTLPYPREAEAIAVGGILRGPGQVWFDDFTVAIDGQDVEALTPGPKFSYPADQDTAFAAGSGVTFPALTPELIDRLELLGRLWGFLKYHHPAVAAGRYNFDAELFRILPAYLGAGPQVEADQVLLDWIDRLGPVPDCVRCTEPPSNPARNFPITVLTDRLSNTVLRERLAHLYRNRDQGEHYYIAMAPQVGNPAFRNEKDYASMALPDAGYRLLALYRYWNMIQYFFPYVEKTDRDWDEVLPAYIPLTLGAATELAYETTILRLIGEVNDTHANLWGGGDRIDEVRGNRYAAVHLRHLEEGFTVDDYYNDELQDITGLEIGDVLLRIGDRAVADLVTEWRPDYPASNTAARYRDMADDLLRSQEKLLAVTVQRGDRTIELTVPLFPREQLNPYRWVPPRTRPALELLEGNIGYVSLQNITEQDIRMLPDTFRNVDGLVIDIRNSPRPPSPSRWEAGC